MDKIGEQYDMAGVRYSAFTGVKGSSHKFEYSFLHPNGMFLGLYGGICILLPYPRRGGALG